MTIFFIGPFHYLSISIEGGMRAVRSNRVRRNAGEHGITLAGPLNETKAIIVKANHDLRIAAWQLFRWRHELPMNKSMIAGRFGSERGTRLHR
jgi:hypothetical protein